MRAEDVLHYIPIIARAPDVPPTDRKFAISILARLNRGSFRPTRNQGFVICRIVREFQDRSMRGGSDD